MLMMMDMINLVDTRFRKNQTLQKFSRKWKDFETFSTRLSMFPNEYLIKKFRN